jgi:hypothetical protein
MQCERVLRSDSEYRPLTVDLTLTLRALSAGGCPAWRRLRHCFCSDQIVTQWDTPHLLCRLGELAQARKSSPDSRGASFFYYDSGQAEFSPPSAWSVATVNDTSYTYSDPALSNASFAFTLPQRQYSPLLMRIL